MESIGLQLDTASCQIQELEALLQAYALPHLSARAIAALRGTSQAFKMLDDHAPGQALEPGGWPSQHVALLMTYLAPHAEGMQQQDEGQVDIQPLLFLSASTWQLQHRQSWPMPPRQDDTWRTKWCPDG